MWLQPRYRKKADFFFSLFFPFYFLSCYSQFSNWLHFQSNLPISISPSHPPLNRAALQVSVGLWYLFMINEGEKKKCKCLPPTQSEINQNRSAGRKEREDGRQRPTALPWSLWSQATIRHHTFTHKHTHLRAQTLGHTQSSPNTTKPTQRSVSKDLTRMLPE